MNDLLQNLKAVVSAEREKLKVGQSRIPQNDILLSSQIPLLTPSFRERSYAMGWIRTQLPGTVGVMGDNIRLMPLEELPTIGVGAPSRLACYHQGATVGYFPAIYIFPETESAVIVLINSIALGDSADWIAQALIEALFDHPDPIDWHKNAVHTRDLLLRQYTAMANEVETSREDSGPQRNLQDYAGDYYGGGGTFFIQIAVKPTAANTLTLSFQGLPSQVYDLHHYRGDTFEWLLSEDETAKCGRCHNFSPPYFILPFIATTKDRIDCLEWRHDPNIDDGEVFCKLG